MGEARGVVSKDELKAYGGANIMLLDGTNEVTVSGIASGSEQYEWVIRWNSDGFVGQGWTVGEWSEMYNFQEAYLNGTLDDILNTGSNGMNISVTMAGMPRYTTNGCGGYQTVG